MNEWTKWMNEWMNEWMNDWIRYRVSLHDMISMTSGKYSIQEKHFKKINNSNNERKKERNKQK